MLEFWVKVIKSNVNCIQEWSELDTKVISICNYMTFSFLITPIKWTLTALIWHEMAPKNEIVCPFL